MTNAATKAKGVGSLAPADTTIKAIEGQSKTTAITVTQTESTPKTTTAPRANPPYNYSRVVPQKSKLEIPYDVWELLEIYADESPGEIHLLGFLKTIPQPDNDKYVLESVVLPKQAVGGAGFETPDLFGVLEEAIDRGLSTATLKFRAHSHVDMSVFWSDTDNGDLNSWGLECQYMVSLVYNRKGERLARLDIFHPTRTWKECDVTIIHPPELVEKIRAEIANKVTFTHIRTAVRPVATATTKGAATKPAAPENDSWKIIESYLSMLTVEEIDALAESLMPAIFEAQESLFTGKKTVGLISPASASGTIELEPPTKVLTVDEPVGEEDNHARNDSTGADGLGIQP